MCHPRECEDQVNIQHKNKKYSTYGPKLIPSQAEDDTKMQNPIQNPGKPRGEPANFSGREGSGLTKNNNFVSIQMLAKASVYFHKN